MSRRFSELLRAIYPARKDNLLAWDQASLSERAACYFRRNVLAEACVICAGFLWPDAPWPIAGLLGVLSVLCTWTASMSAVVLLQRRESLLDALLGRPGS